MRANSVSLSGVDQCLVEALQVNPRATWSLVGDVLGMSAVTAARRGQRLVQDGIVWVTAYGSPSFLRQHVLAYIEVNCIAADVDRAAARLAQDPRTFTVDYVAGASDLMVTASAADLDMMSRYVRDKVATLPGVTATRTHLTTRLFIEGSKWKLRALDSGQLERLTPDGQYSSRHDGQSRPELLTALERQAMVALSIDGRREVSGLAKDLDVSPATARRVLERLLAKDALRFRTDVAATYTDWPILVYYWTSVPTKRINDIGRIISSLPETRLCAALTGPHNLLFGVWLRGLTDSLRLEMQLADRLPELTVADRAVGLMTFKRMGRLLDTRGRAIGVVPMDIWAEPANYQLIPEGSTT